MNINIMYEGLLFFMGEGIDDKKKMCVFWWELKCLVGVLECFKVLEVEDNEVCHGVWSPLFFYKLFVFDGGRFIKVRVPERECRMMFPWSVELSF